MSTPDHRERCGAVPAPPTPPDIAVAAADAGLLDVAYATEDSPSGRLLLAVTPQGLVRVAYLDARRATRTPYFRRWPSGCRPGS